MASRLSEMHLPKVNCNSPTTNASRSRHFAESDADGAEGEGEIEVMQGDVPKCQKSFVRAAPQ